MAKLEITKNVYYIGTEDWDREIFDELIPLPEGTSYNSYLIEGSDKTAIIDTADPAKYDIYISNIKNIKIDYIISNHAEQDHSGLIPEVLKLNPHAKIVTNEKCKTFLIDLLHLDEKDFFIIDNNDTLSLGDKTLKFILYPWVHWPETMLTYLIEDQILFSCDLFGAHYAGNSLFVKDKYKLYYDAKRYFSEIMMPFTKIISKNFSKVTDLSINYIAPSHGPVHNEPDFIIDAYKDWLSETPKNLVLLCYVSMHESTRIAMEYLLDILTENKIDAVLYNLTKTDVGDLANHLVDASTIIFGTPTVLAQPHPTCTYTAVLANALKSKFKYAGIINSYSWGGKTVDILKSTLSNFKGEFFEPVMIKGKPREEDYKQIKELANKIIEKNR